MRFIFCTIYVIISIEYTNSQSTEAINNTETTKSKCEHSALIEQFFNVIFNEFQNTPPVCVCVQMCPDHFAYCYPNGCLKLSNSNRKREISAVALLNENTKPIFIINEDVRKDMDITINDSSRTTRATPLLVTPDDMLPINLRPDAFKDRYKTLFRYNRIPKVELKYNLGEQVKNMKADALKKDTVSQTRWPKFNPAFYKHMGPKENSKLFMSMLLDKGDIINPTKYFKRETQPNCSKYYNNADDAKFLQLQKQLTSNNSSLESFLDLSMETTIDTISNDTNSNNTEFLTEKYNEISSEEFASEKFIETTTLPSSAEFVSDNTVPINNTDIISVNLTNEKIDKNKYIKTNVENSANKFTKKITSLTRKIGVKNNMNLEIFRRMAKNFNFYAAENIKKASDLGTNIIHTLALTDQLLSSSKSKVLNQN